MQERKHKVRSRQETPPRSAFRHASVGPRMQNNTTDSKWTDSPRKGEKHRANTKSHRKETKLSAGSPAVTQGSPEVHGNATISRDALGRRLFSASSSNGKAGSGKERVGDSKTIARSPSMPVSAKYDKETREKMMRDSLQGSQTPKKRKHDDSASVESPAKDMAERRRIKKLMATIQPQTSLGRAELKKQAKVAVQESVSNRRVSGFSNRSRRSTSPSAESSSEPEEPSNPTARIATNLAATLGNISSLGHEMLKSVASSQRLGRPSKTAGKGMSPAKTPKRRRLSSHNEKGHAPSNASEPYSPEQLDTIRATSWAHASPYRSDPNPFHGDGPKHPFQTAAMVAVMSGGTYAELSRMLKDMKPRLRLIEQARTKSRK